MLKLKMLGIALLAAVTVVSAADAEKKDVDKKEAAKKVEEKKITPYGMAQYRLRTESIKSGEDGDFETSYYHRVAYYLGVKATVGKKFSAALQVGNRAIMTEDVQWSPVAEKPNDATENAKDSTVRDYIPYFHLAYAKWNPGFLSISGGIIPMKSNGALDLMERSMNKEVSSLDDLSSVSYKKASNVGWNVGADNSLMGLQLAVPILKKDIVKLGVDVSATMVDNVKNFPSRSKVLWIVNAPFKASILSFTPQLAILQNRLVNETTDEKDGEIAIGAKVGVAPNKKMAFGLSLGMAQCDNENTKDKDDDVTKKSGKYLSVSAKIKAGPGKIQAAYKVSNDKTEIDEKSDDTKHSVYHYIDLKYGIAAHKNFTIMPRVRFFMDRWADDAVNKTSQATKIRPELLLIGKF